MTLLLYIFLPLFTATGLVLYLWFKWYRKVPAKVQTEGGKVESIAEDELSLVLCYGSDNGLFDEKGEELTTEIIQKIKQEYGSLGRLWDEDGKKMYHINKYRVKGSDEYHYRPIESLMAETRDNPPEDIHGCFDQDAVKIWYNVQENVNALVKWGPILWFCGITMFILFIWGSSLLK